MNTACVLVANASRARLYTVPKAKLLNGHCSSLSLLAELEHPESRKMDSELTTDRYGSCTHNSMINGCDPKKHEADNFAREIVHCLEEAANQKKFDEIIVTAPPQFHGMLNSHLNSLRKRVTVDIKKDYTQDNEKQIIDHLRDFL
ncbi:MAG: host attachment protein [Proteobacteria bacterium]|nr:host attachment protein [Pseudomonadota bacterium]